MNGRSPDPRACELMPIGMLKGCRVVITMRTPRNDIKKAGPYRYSSGITSEEPTTKGTRAINIATRYTQLVASSSQRLRESSGAHWSRRKNSRQTRASSTYSSPMPKQATADTMMLSSSCGSSFGHASPRSCHSLQSFIHDDWCFRYHV